MKMAIAQHTVETGHWENTTLLHKENNFLGKKNQRTTRNNKKSLKYEQRRFPQTKQNLKNYIKKGYAQLRKVVGNTPKPKTTDKKKPHSVPRTRVFLPSQLKV